VGDLRLSASKFFLENLKNFQKQQAGFAAGFGPPGFFFVDLFT